MATKKTAGTTVVTEGAAQAALRRRPAKELLAEEDNVMRMRLGASPPRTATLERKVAAMSDAEIEVLAYEIEAHMKWRALQEERAAAVVAEPRPPFAVPSRTKEKIIRALRKKS